MRRTFMRMVLAVLFATPFGAGFAGADAETVGAEPEKRVKVSLIDTLPPA